MNQGYALSKESPSGYLVSVSGKELKSIKVPTTLHFMPHHIMVTSVYGANHRPHVSIHGLVNSLTGAFGKEVEQVVLNEPMPIIVDYTLTDDEIAILAMKGFFHAGYPVQDITCREIDIPHEVSCLVFDGAEVPVIVVDLHDSHEITCDSTGIGRVLVDEFPTYRGKIHTNTFDKSQWVSQSEREDKEEIVTQHINEETQVDDVTKGQDVTEIAETVIQKNTDTITSVLEETLADMTQPPKELAWNKDTATFSTDSEVEPNTVTEVPVVPESEYKTEDAMTFGE